MAMRGRGHALEAGASLTYSYRGQDEQMEENGDTEDREEKNDEGEERQKCTRDIFVHHVDRVSNMVFNMMLSLRSNMLGQG